jgi:hemoglobin
MKKDIESKKDIEILVDAFYVKVTADDLIGFIFTENSNVNWEQHLPIMYSFFENMLFYTGSYTGNPMELHKHVNRLYPLTIEHFSRWIHLFETTVDDLYTGEKAELAKQRAKSIAAVMQIKIFNDTSSADKIF